MLPALATLFPVALVLGLLAFGDHGGRRPPPLTARSALPVLAAAVVLGPVSVAVLGFAVWLVVVVVVIATMLMVSLLRQPPLRH